MTKSGDAGEDLVGGFGPDEGPGVSSSRGLRWTHKAADYVNTITGDEITTLIRETGFTPAQRTTT